MHTDGCSACTSLLQGWLWYRKALWPARTVETLNSMPYLSIPCVNLPLTQLDLRSRHVEPLHHMQMSKPGEVDGLQALLDSITARTCPDVDHAAYHAKHLEQLMHQMESQPARCLQEHVLPNDCTGFTVILSH